MAAYAALVSLMHIIHDIEDHPFPPIFIDNQQLQSLTEFVTSFQEFLQAYRSSVSDIDEADSLEIRIARAAYAAEDVIESHIAGVKKFGARTAPLDQETESQEEENCEGEVNCINLYEDLQQVIEEMILIKKHVRERVTEKAVLVHNQRQIDDVPALQSSSIVQNVMMVCPDDVLDGIMEKLVGMPLHRKVIPIVGMGGIGKTTLAENIYAQPLIKAHFDVCAWVTITQQYNIRQILCQLLSLKEEESESTDDILGVQLHKYLFGRRFLIVMDDMWSLDAWHMIQHFFPNNENGSRILVTTRLSRLSSQLNNEYIHQMEFLDEVNSLVLFSKIVFREESFPLELAEIGKEIVENCKGLPLSIVVVGGLLKKLEQTQECWESIKNNVTSLVNLDNDRHCLRLLKMSYNHLPVYLKPCFLYMGVFEEHRAMRVSRLIKLWVSEGLLKPMNGKSSRTMAKGFLKDLVDRNLVLVDRLGSTGNIKSCKIHDLLRDLCLRESQKYEFYHVIRQGSLNSFNSQRRVVIGKSISTRKVFDTLQGTSHTRSIICENRRSPRCNMFGLLRTLEAYKVSSNQTYVNDLVSGCVNLRHLVVRVQSMSSFLSSIDLVWNLHTLIVYCWEGCSAPVALWRMPQIRHLEFTREPLCLPDPPSSGCKHAVVMKNLEELKGVKNFKCGEEVVKRIPNVRKLGVIYCNDDDNDDYSLTNIESLTKLESLDVSCDKNRVVVSLQNLTFPCFLKSLNLRVDSEFGWEEMMEKIGSLPLLLKLKLAYGCFRTCNWEIGEGQFPSLKYLS